MFSGTATWPFFVSTPSRSFSLTAAVRLILPLLSVTLSSSALAAASAPAPAAPAPAAADPAATWDLSMIYPTPAAWQAAKDKLAADIPKIKAYEGHLGDSAASLRAAMDLVYGLRKEYSRLETYASLNRDENTRVGPALERSQEIDLVGTEFSRAASFISPEILKIGEERLRAYIGNDRGLEQYRFPLMEIVRNAPHTLGPEAEGVISAAGLITGSPAGIYQVLSNADIPWPTIKLSDGREAHLDDAGYTLWRQVPNRDDRKAVFEAFWGKHHEYERTFAVSLFSQVQSDWFRATVRKFPSSLAAALNDSNIPEAVYRTLIAQTNASLPTLQRYFRLRGKMLGIPDLRYWDIYPPLVESDRKYSYEEAKRLVTAAIQPLGPDYVKAFTESLSGRYTHVYPQPGKLSGAYMNGSAYDVHPFVLMNFNGDYESVSTLAHEWGHGIHSVLANRSQPFATSDYPIFTAEIASTTNEALLLEYMLKVAQSDDEKLYYLGTALEGLRSTFYRQAMFAEFELAIHEVVEKGGALSAEKLNQMYGDLLRRYHGDDKGVLKIDDLVTVEWAYIPHFYRDFYVYQYATSIAAGQAFAARILAGQPGAVDTYLGLLKAGGSDHPYDLVKRAGVDLATPAPYQALVARMNSIMDQIEQILARRGPAKATP